MQEIYKGYKIEYSDFKQTFSAKIGDNSYANVNLEKVRKHIDDLEKKDFERVNVLFEKGWRGKGIEKGMVTSAFKEGKYTSSCWVSYEERPGKKTRTKEICTRVYLDNESNRQLFADIAAIRSEIAKLNEKEQTTRSLLERYEPELLEDSTF